MTQEKKHIYKFRAHPCGEFLQFFKDKELIEDFRDASIFCKQASHFYPLLEACKEALKALSYNSIPEILGDEPYSILEQAIKAAEAE